MSVTEPGALQQPVAPTTTHQEDLTVLGQRKINLIWEVTQALIALMVVLANMVVAVYIGVFAPTVVVFPQVLSNTLFLVVGFYFSRTNHQAIGGVGAKASDGQNYLGR